MNASDGEKLGDALNCEYCGNLSFDPFYICSPQCPFSITEAEKRLLTKSLQNRYYFVSLVSIALNKRTMACNISITLFWGPLNLSDCNIFKKCSKFLHNNHILPNFLEFRVKRGVKMN